MSVYRIQISNGDLLIDETGSFINLTELSYTFDVMDFYLNYLSC